MLARKLYVKQSLDALIAFLNRAEATGHSKGRANQTVEQAGMLITVSSYI
jgi:hypothetical protein